MKKKKLPKLFTTPLSESDFERKVLKRIYLKEYRDFLSKTLVKDAAGRRVVKDDLAKKERARLGKIATSIRKNKGFVQKGKLVLVGIVIGLIVLFNLFFKDMLVESAAEAGLESVFGARADIRNLKFQVLAGRVALDHLEVADSGRPMRNLFELGATEIKIDLIELLKGNVILENIMCREIRWDTPRSFSGALPGRSVPEEKKDEAGQPQTEDPFAFLNQASAAASDILAAEKEKLSSLKTLDSLAADYPERIKGWENRLADLSGKWDDASSAVKEAAAINVGTIKTIDDAAKAYAVVDKAYKETKNYEEDLDAVYKQYKEDLAKVNADQKRLSSEIASDLSRLEASITAPLGSGQSLVTALVENLLARTLGDFYGYLKQAVGYVELLKPTGERKAKEPSPEERYGFVRFPGRVSPKFWLQKAEASVGSLDADYIRGRLTDLSGEPDIVGRPVAFLFEQKIASQLINVEGALDGRKNSKEFLKADVRLDGFPYTLESGLEFLNIGKFSARADFSVGFSMDKQQRTGGTVTITLKNPVFTKGGSPSRFTERAYDALQKVPVIRIAGRYSTNPDGSLALSMDTNLDEILGSIIAGIVDELLLEAKTKLKAEFDKLLQEKLGENKSLVAGFVKLDDIFKGDFSSLAGATKLLDGKKAEITKAAGPLQGKAGNELDKLRKKFGF